MQGVASKLAWMIAMSVCATPIPVWALTCEYFPKAVEQSASVVILQPGKMLQELAKTDIYVPAGMPTQYDLVRFEVVEVLRGAVPTQLDMYCPHTTQGACTPDQMPAITYIGQGAKFSDYEYPTLYACVYGSADEDEDPALKKTFGILRSERSKLSGEIPLKPH